MLLKFIISFLDKGFERAVLNTQSSSWKPVLARVPQGFVLGPLFFLTDIYMTFQKISYLYTKLFADDTSIYSTVKNVNVSTDQLISDLENTLNWAHQWKMSFNLDPKKQAQEVFSRQRMEDIHQFFSMIL